jgi:sugar transferase (PEP-CTERM/EpsH1 system associated)
MADLSITDMKPGVRASSAMPAVRPAAKRESLRVMHVLTSLGHGGTESVVLNLLRGLADQGFEQKICTTRGYDAQFVRERHLEGQVESAGKSEVTFQFPLFRLARIMRAYRPHIVHTRNWGALEAVPAAKLAGVPVIIHSEHGYEMDNLEGLPFRRRVFRRGAYAMADAVFTVSKELRDYHTRQAWLGQDRMHVVYNGVDTNRFSARPEIRQQLRNDFGWTANSFVIGTVGRVVAIKDQKTLFAAAEVLAGAGIDVQVLLVGTGPELNNLRRDVAAMPNLGGRVHFVGASSQVNELLNVMDAFVLPSLNEGMSNTLLEAMATGLPVVATRVGGNPEILDNDRCGWLFTPRDVGGLAERLTKLAKNAAMRQALGAGARQRIAEAFDINLMIEKYRRLYLETAALKGLVAEREATN